MVSSERAPVQHLSQDLLTTLDESDGDNTPLAV